MVSQKQDNSEQQEAFIEHLRYAWRCSKGAAQINSSALIVQSCYSPLHFPGEEVEAQESKGTYLRHHD